MTLHSLQAAVSAPAGVRKPSAPRAFETWLRQLDRWGVRYCVLRDADRLDELALGGELDVLVHAADRDRLEAAAAASAFVQLPAWGRAPHRFYVHYDARSDAWFKCDVVTTVAYGRPAHALTTGLGEACLAARQHDGHVWVPCPEDELITLLLHVILDTRAIQPPRRRRAVLLRRRIQHDDRISGHLQRYWPGMSWPQLASLIDSGNWPAMLAERDTLARHVCPDARWRLLGRRARDRALRTAHRLTRLVRPDMPSVALLAPDGAGKTTLISGVRESFFTPVHTAHMGMHQGRVKSDRSSIPGVGLLRLLLAQWRRYLLARWRQAGGQLVLFDRYGYDALLPSAVPLGAVSRLRRWALAHSCPAPDLVVLLDAPGEALFARKAEHSAAVLERQRQCYLRMRERIGPSVVVDASTAPESIRRRVTALIWEALRRRLRRHRRR
jgi:thymidylate kinase